MVGIPKKSWIFEKITEIYRAAEEVESSSDSFTDTFSEAQFIESAIEEVDVQLKRLFKELHEFLKNIKEGNGVDEGKLDLLLYILGE